MDNTLEVSFGIHAACYEQSARIKASIPFIVHLNYVYSIIVIATSIIAPFDKFAWNANTISKDLHREVQDIAP